MKKLIFLIVTITYSCTVMGQRVMLNEGVSIELPSKIENITKDQALDHVTHKLNNNKVALYNINSGSNKIKHFYKIDNVLISINAFNTTFRLENNHISNLKKGLDEIGSTDKSYESFIKKGDHNSSLITSSISGSVKTYRFYCYNDNNTRAITGEFESDLSDTVKASTILNDFLQSIKFKD